MQKYQFNQLYFDNIDSIDKAYWLGFILAEGNIYRNTLSIKLHSKDESHLEIFKNAINSSHPIKKMKNKSASRFRICSKKLCKSLAVLNVIPNKKDHIIFPNITENLISSLILGYFDGDGWITKYKPKDCKKETFNVGFTSCSKIFLQSIQTYINNAIQIPNAGSMFPKYYKTKTNIDRICYTLTYGGNQLTYKVTEYLYNKKEIYLKRKYNIVELLKDLK